MVQNSEKSSSMLIHLSALASYLFPFGSLLLPLILWQTTKKDSEYINHHGKEAVNFNLSFFIYNIIAIFVLLGSIIGTIFGAIQAGESENIAGLLFGTGGFISAVVVLSIIGIIKLILMIIAAIKANEGNLYKYPLTIRFIR